MYRCRQFLRLLCLTFFVVGNSTASAIFQNTKVQPQSNLFQRFVLSKGPKVDKSLFIIDVLEGPSAVCVCRPTSFGKTTNLRMLEAFFRCDKNTTHLFKDLKIMDPKYQTMREKYMNKHPVVYINFRLFRPTTCKKNSSGSSLYFGSFKELFKNYKYLSASKKLTEQEKKSILQYKCESEIDCFSSIKDLCELLYLHHGVAPIILIDEIDAPLMEAKITGMYEQVSKEMRQILFCTLDLNENYFKVIITSVLPLFEDERFVRLGPIETDTFLQPLFKPHFGFTLDDVKYIMRDYRTEETKKLNLKTLCEWYNGYKVGTETMFNTVSVCKCLHTGGELTSYQNVFSEPLGEWLKSLLLNHGSLPALNIQCLCKNIVLKKHLTPDFLQLNNMKTVDETDLWNVLYFAGLITFDASSKRENDYKVDIKCPNKEVKDLLQTKVLDTLVNAKVIPDYDTFSKKVYDRDEAFVLEWMEKYVVGAQKFMNAKGGGHKPTLKNLVDYINLIFKGFQKIYGVNSTTTSKGRFATTVYRNITTPDQKLLEIDVEVEPGKLKKVRQFFTRPNGFSLWIETLGHVQTIVKFIHSV